MKRTKLLVLTAAFLSLGFARAWPADRPSDGEQKASSGSPPVKTVAPVSIDLSWISINGGGISYGSGGTRRLGYSVGQSVADREGSGGTRKVGIGFWYGSTRVCAAAKGDMDDDTFLTSSDVVLLLLCVFTGSSPNGCNNCFADVNCDTNLDSSDVVLLLLATYTGAPFPCI